VPAAQYLAKVTAVNQNSEQAAWMADVAPVTRPVTSARAAYDRIAPIYDLLEEPFERHAKRIGLDLLAVQPGERILEIGPGTGHCLATLARRARPAGLVTGVDLSARMLRQTRRLTGRSGVTSRIGLVQGDAHRLPLRDGAFDAIFTSFFLELIATRQIPVVLGECRRVLRDGGRIVVVSLQHRHPQAPAARLYLAARRYLPGLLDCRPIPVPHLLAATGWHVQALRRLTVAGLPVTAAAATPASS
jgi:ubiquinone/menaquinone biosynthesis C-methylase UbiE